MNNELYEKLLRMAGENPRRRQHYDLRDSEEDTSQRMLNAILPESVIPIHRHRDTGETVVVVKGCVEEVLYEVDDTSDAALSPNNVRETKRIRMEVGEGCQVPRGVYHTAIALVPSVIVEFKNGKYDAVLTEECLRQVNSEK